MSSVVEVQRHVEVEALGRVEGDDGVEEDGPQWELHRALQQRLKVVHQLGRPPVEVLEVGEVGPGGRPRRRQVRGVRHQVEAALADGRVDEVLAQGGVERRIGVPVVADADGGHPVRARA